MQLQEIREKVHLLVDECDSEILRVVKIMLENYNDSHELAAKNIGGQNGDLENDTSKNKVKEVLITE